MRILFLHGWQSVPGGVKPTFLAQHGHEVINPKLPDEDFAEAVRIAQAEFDKRHPQVVVGSSRGGAVAMNIKIGEARLVLLCPAWKKWGTVKTVKPGTVILHSKADEVIPFADSEELVRTSGLPVSALIEVGTDHRLADLESLTKMIVASEGFVSLEEHLQRMAEASGRSGQFAALVLRWGNRYFGQQRPKKYGSGQPTVCYANSYRSAKRHKLIYVEGYGSSPFYRQPILHAWCVEPGSTLVIDRTCRMLEYIGIPFQFCYVHDRWRAGSIGVIDDETGGWPLLKLSAAEMESIIEKNG